MKFRASTFLFITLFSVARGFLLINKALFSEGTTIKNKMAQKSMRSFFSVTKATGNGSGKKPRLDGDSLSEVVGSVTALKAIPSSIADDESNGDRISPSNQCPASMLDEEWKVRLSAEFGKPYFKALTEFVDIEYQRVSVYPPRDQIYSAFNLCPFNDVKARHISISLRKGAIIKSVLNILAVSFLHSLFISSLSVY